jgi:flagellar hook-associated protein 1 FlgK
MVSALSMLTENMKSLDRNANVMAENISKGEDPNYIRRESRVATRTMSGQESGVYESKIERMVDVQQQQIVWQLTPQKGMSDAMLEYVQLTDNLYGSPLGDDAFETMLSSVSEAFQELVQDVTQGAFRQNAAQQLQEVTKKLQTMSDALYQYRFDADQEIYKITLDTNAKLEALHNINEGLNSGVGDLNDLYDARDALIQQIAENISVRPRFTERGAVYIATSDGVTLLDSALRYLDYTPLPYVETFINNTPFSPLSVVLEGKTSDQAAFTTALMTGGSEGEIKSRLQGGRLEGLREVRDIHLLRMQQQIDNFAKSYRDGINAIHNLGAGFPPPTRIQSEHMMKSDEPRQMTGKVQIIVVNDAGKPAKLDNGKKILPMTIDLLALSSEYGSGVHTPDSLSQAINQRFFMDPTIATTEVGGLTDIKLVAMSPTISANGSFTFDFRLSNFSQAGQTFEVLGVDVTDTGCVGLTSALPSSTLLLKGDEFRTGKQITVNFAGGSGGPYNINAQVKVTDSVGNVSLATLQFAIDDTPADSKVLNTHYPVAQVITGDARIVPANNIKPILKASRQDAEGYNVDANHEGYLVIEAMMPGMRIIINEVSDSTPSKDLGYIPPAGLVTPATYKSFSHYYNLNNLLASPNEERNASRGMSVKQSILDNPNLMALGAVKATPAGADVGTMKARAKLTFQNNPGLGDTISFNGVNYTFVDTPIMSTEVKREAALLDTLHNLASTLSALSTPESSMLSVATYTILDSDNALVVSYNTPGIEGNRYEIGWNFSNNALLSFNSKAVDVSGHHALEGGKNEPENPYTYELGIASNRVAAKLSALNSSALTFAAAGALPEISTTFSSYLASMINFQVNLSIKVESKNSNDVMLHDHASTALEEVSAVDIEQEMVNAMVYKQLYHATAMMLKTTKEMRELLMNVAFGHH